jgi:glycosyltransferase involved in cell wall biosynthesis
MRKNSPRVSVIIPSRNRPLLLLNTIESVLVQTFKDLEIIVVDDGSDVPLNPLLVEKFGEQVVCVRHEHSCGAPAARNAGLKRAKGDFIAFLDDDDIWLQEKLEKQIDAFSQLGEEIGVVYCGYDFWVDGEVVERKNEYHESTDLSQIALMKCPIGSPTPLIRRFYLDQVDGFDLALPACQDWDLWVRLSKVCSFFPVRESLAQYRVHGQQISTDISRQISARRMLVEKYQEEYAVYPKVLSAHFRRLGSLCVLTGQCKEARFYFWQSIQSDKSNLGSWLHLILQFCGKWLDKFLIDKYGVLKVGKIKILN